MMDLVTWTCSDFAAVSGSIVPNGEPVCEEFGGKSW